jgi:hypothetical protein
MSLIRGKRVKSMLKQAAAEYRFQTSDFKVQSALDLRSAPDCVDHFVSRLDVTKL